MIYRELNRFAYFTSEGAENICVHVCTDTQTHTCISFVSAGSEMMDHMLGISLICKRMARLFLKWLYHLHHLLFENPNNCCVIQPLLGEPCGLVERGLNV